MKCALAPLFVAALLGAAGCGGGGGGTGGGTGTTTESSSSSSSSGAGGHGGMGTSSSSSSSSSGSTGGAGGTGGHGGMGTGGSGGTGGMPCTAPGDCPATGSECVVATCDAGACGTTLTPAQTPISTQVAGDCHKKVCDGAGNVVNDVDDSDPPDDGWACSNDVCTNGTASHPLKPAGSSCGGTSVCDVAGNCVGCTQASECGTNTVCKLFNCTAGTCGSSNLAAGTVVANATPGDCHSDQCDGNGGVTMGAVDPKDKPADDGNACTLEVCTAGAPGHPPAPVGTPCAQGGSTCDGAGQCVGCTTDGDCAAGGACQVAHCTAGLCGFTAAPAHVLAAAQQVAGDCQQLACDGTSQTPVSTADATDVPADDGKACTAETCTAGMPAHPPLPLDTVCTQGGGTRCDGNGNCVGCTTSSQCMAANACQTPVCTAGTCGFTPVGAGTVVANPMVGDCKSDQCDGAGHVMAAANDGTDLPVDNNACTLDVCTAGVASNPPAPAGTPCAQMGGTSCDGLGACVTGPAVLSVSPADGATPATSVMASTTVAVTFTQAMNPTTLTAQVAVGACTGSIQVSVNDFATCVGFTSAAPAMNAGNTVATLVPAPGLLVNRLYKVRVTTAAASATSVPLPAAYTSSVGFTTTNPLPYNGGVVISQVYGGGGNTGAPYKNDFIELHNRGSAAVTVTGWSVQYLSATGTGAWAVTNLTGTIQPGAYYLVQEAAGAGTAPALPTPNATGTLALASGAGKVALVNTTTALTGCPTGAQIVDLVGFGTTATCSETAPTTAPSNTTAVLRNLSGCVDTDRNAADFTAGAPAPRNDMSAGFRCAPAQNESGGAAEINYCDVQFPLTLSVQTGMMSPAVYGQIYQPGVTEAMGADASVTAQLGYGPATSNPEYEAGWNWTATMYNVQSGNNDEYQGTLLAPAVGSYRYVYRFSIDGGASWTYCDANQGDHGAGSTAGKTFDFEDEGVLTVTP
jgi:hypothetical protein